MKYETMKNFQLLFDKAAATGILNIYTIRKSAEEGEDWRWNACSHRDHPQGELQR